MSDKEKDTSILCLTLNAQPNPEQNKWVNILHKGELVVRIKVIRAKKNQARVIFESEKSVTDILRDGYKKGKDSAEGKDETS